MDIIRAILDFYRGHNYKLVHYPVKKKSKFAIVCPGGGYSMVCSFGEGKPFARELNKMGYHAFVLYYRTGKKGHYPAPQDDLARAVKYILDNSEALNVEKEGYCIFGSSAGGHLTASFGTPNMGYSKYDLPKPAALVLCYPVITMGALTHQGSADNLLGIDRTAEDISFASVEKHVDKSYPPTFLWQCRPDDVVDYRNSVMLRDELQKHNIPHRFTLYDEGGHGLGLALDTPAEGWFKSAVDFWTEQTKA